MNKNILAIAIAAAVAAPAVFANATVYGNIHESVNSFGGIKGASNTKTTDLNSVSSNSSYVGVKGAEDLTGGMKAVYQIEMQVALDGSNGTGSGSEGINSSLRNSFAGLGGGFGTVLVGRHDSLIKMSGRKYDLFGDQVGNNRNALGNANATASFVVDGRHNNVLAYVSPTWSGFHFGVAYVPGDAVTQADNITGDASEGTKNPALTAIADYTAGPLSVTAGYINIAANGSTAINAIKDITAYRLGGAYTFGQAKVVALYQNDNIFQALGSGKERNTYGIGGSYNVGTGSVKAQVYVADSQSATGTAKNGAMLTTVGYDHNLSKNTTAYAVYSLADNAKGGSYAVDMAGSGTGSNVTAITGKDNSAFSVGLIHKF